MLKRVALIAALTICAISCQRSPDSLILGEWTARRVDGVDHVTVLTHHVRYRGDHTFSGVFDDPRRGLLQQSGTWRIEGNRIISKDEHGESRAEIVRLTRNELEFRPPDGVIARYTR